MKFLYTKTTSIIITIILVSGCQKFIQIPPPVGQVTTSQVFATDAQAISAVSGIYYNMINQGQLSFGSGGITLFAGMSADELEPFDKNFSARYIEFQQNKITASNSYNYFSIWQQGYSNIYAANAVIQGLQDYSGVHDSVKEELTGEAEFIRAFCNFYLINLYGDIPLVSTINWQKTNLLNRTQTSQVNDSIITDLKSAQRLLPADYSAIMGQRIIPNKWAATAMLARVYLYMGKWQEAESQATSLINNTSLFSLDSLSDIFLANSTESIWQLQQSNIGYFNKNATPEGFKFIPRNAKFFPFVYLTDQLHNDFEAGDERYACWIDSTVYEGTTYYYPYKYKIGPGQATAGGPYTEYYTVLRLAEQYLILAEAEAEQGESSAIKNLNIIRNRAGLVNYTGLTDKISLLNAIAHERQIELMCEWGHRWFDLIRTGKATQVLSSNKGLTVNSNALLFPIPLSELIVDPNLTQNTGY